MARDCKGSRERAKSERKQWPRARTPLPPVAGAVRLRTATGGELSLRQADGKSPEVDGSTGGTAAKRDTKEFTAVREGK